MSEQKVLVVAESEAHKERADQVAARLNLRCILAQECSCSNVAPLWLWVGKKGIGLKTAADQQVNPVIVNFISGVMGYRKQHLSFKNELIAKAIAIKSSLKLHVLDATAGFGRDAFVLASLGCKVQMLERNPLVALMLEDGMARARHDADCRSTIDRMRLYLEDSKTYLSRIEGEDLPDVIYLDPMFPSRRKAAKVKKEMQLLHLLLEKPDSQEGLLSLAREKAVRKVVVKRPRHAPFLDDQQPNYQVEGKSSRYDIYLTV